MLNNVETPAITALRVPNGQRSDFLPEKFGKHYLRGEPLVYWWMDKLSPDYTGGYWHFYSLSNGGFYMAPDFTEPVRIQVIENFYDGEMSADAAGIVATLYALNDLAWKTRDENVIELYHHLREFAHTHIESGLIFRAID